MPVHASNVTFTVTSSSFRLRKQGSFSSLFESPKQGPRSRCSAVPEAPRAARRDAHLWLGIPCFSLVFESPKRGEAAGRVRAAPER